MKGLFIPGITTEMFRNGSLESIEALMADGKIYDIDYQEPSEDCIRRAKALKVIKQMDIPEDMSVFEIKSHMSVGIFTLPPVTSTRMKGKWINILPCTTNFQDQIIYQCVCDRCSSIAYFRKMCGKLVGANLCPVCGAEMQEVEE